MTVGQYLHLQPLTLSTVPPGVAYIHPENT